MHNSEITRAIVDAMLCQTKGAFFSVEFEKADGTRTVRCAKARQFAKAHTVGGRDNLANSNALQFWSINDRGWRAFRCDRLIAIRCGKRLNWSA